MGPTRPLVAQEITGRKEKTKPCTWLHRPRRRGHPVEELHPGRQVLHRRQDFVEGQRLRRLERTHPVPQRRSYGDTFAKLAECSGGFGRLCPSAGQSAHSANDTSYNAFLWVSSGYRALALDSANLTPCNPMAHKAIQRPLTPFATDVKCNGQTRLSSFRPLGGLLGALREDCSPHQWSKDL